MKYFVTMVFVAIYFLCKGQSIVLTSTLITSNQWESFATEITGINRAEIQNSTLLEHRKSHKRHLLLTGQYLRYKTLASRRFEKGRIKEITDRTIVFEDKEGSSISFLYGELAVLKIPRSVGRNIGGTCLIIPGLGLFAIGVGDARQNHGGELAQLTYLVDAAAMVVGLAMVGGGLILLKDKKIDLQKSWTIRTTQSLSMVTTATKPPLLLNH